MQTDIERDRTAARIVVRRTLRGVDFASTESREVAVARLTDLLVSFVRRVPRCARCQSAYHHESKCPE